MTEARVDLTQASADLIDAFNEADWERFRGLLSPDTVYTETGTGRRVEGAEDYVTLCQGWRVALPDVHGTVRSTIATEDQVAQEILWAGTHTGPMETPGGTLPPSGAQVSVEASFWVRFDGDKAREIHHYLDVLSLLQQVGAIPRQPA